MQRKLFAFEIKCIVLPVRIHLKTFMGWQWLYLERLSVLRYSWAEVGVNIAPETLSISKLLRMLELKSQSTALVVYGIYCDNKVVCSVLSFEENISQGGYLSSSTTVTKKVTTLDIANIFITYLKSHCCHRLICHFSDSLPSRWVIPPNTSNLPPSASSSLQFLSLFQPVSWISMCTNTLHSLW